MPKTTLAMSAPMILEEDTDPMTMEEAIEELFGAVITATDSEDRIYSYDFRLLPSKHVSIWEGVVDGPLLCCALLVFCY